MVSHLLSISMKCRHVNRFAASTGFPDALKIKLTGRGAASGGVLLPAWNPCRATTVRQPRPLRSSAGITPGTPFITSSPRWLMTLTAMRPEPGRSKGREVSLFRVAQASASMSALSVVFRLCRDRRPPGNRRAGQKTPLHCNPCR